MITRGARDSLLHIPHDRTWCAQLITTHLQALAYDATAVQTQHDPLPYSTPHITTHTRARLITTHPQRLTTTHLQDLAHDAAAAIDTARSCERLRELMRLYVYIHIYIYHTHIYVDIYKSMYLYL